MMFGEMVRQIDAAFAPVNEKLLLVNTILNPIALEQRCFIVLLVIQHVVLLSVCSGVGGYGYPFLQV